MSAGRGSRGRNRIVWSSCTRSAWAEKLDTVRSSKTRAVLIFDSSPTQGYCYDSQAPMDERVSTNQTIGQYRNVVN